CPAVSARRWGEGSLVELSLKNGKTLFTPKVTIDRSQFPNADNEYTPAQWRAIDARLAKADTDIRSGRMSRAFGTHAGFIADLHRATKKLRGKRTRLSA